MEFSPVKLAGFLVISIESDYLHGLAYYSALKELVDTVWTPLVHSILTPPRSFHPALMVGL